MAKKSVWSIIKYQRAKVPPVPTADLTGQTVVVVGANTGIGFEAAKHFAQMNPGKLILACRNEAKGKAAVDRIREETGFDRVELRLLDLASFSSVSTFADTFEGEGRLDILLMNAGIGPLVRKVTADGWEETLQVNDISTSLVSLLLTPKLVETAKTHGTHPRIVVVSSDMHHWSKIQDEVLNDPAGPFKVLSDDTNRTMVRYMESKLLNIFFVRSLASLLSSTPVIVDSVNPGYCYSDMRRDLRGAMAKFHYYAEKLLAWTAEEGARQLLWAAVGGSEDVDQLRGAYISTMKTEEPADFITGKDGKRREEILWADLVRVLSKIDGRVPGIVERFSSASQ